MNRDDNDLENELTNLTQTLEELTIQQHNLRRQSLNVEQRIERIRREQRRRTLNTFARTVTRRDRHGDVLDIGDYVNFLKI